MKTQRLLLTPLDSEQLRQAALTEPDPEMRGALSEMLAGAEKDPGNRLWYTNWEISLRQSGEKIGSLGFKGPPDCGAVELGYGIDPAHAGQGYATEAAEAAVDWAFSRRDVRFVTAETAPENAASQRVLEKLGFLPTGRSGREGPRFEKEQPFQSRTAVYLCFGMSIGLALGSPWDKSSLCMLLGIGAGAALGQLLDAAERKKRADLCARRLQKENATPPQEAAAPGESTRRP